MKNVLWRIAIILLLLLTALIICIGLYIGVPSFKERVDGILPKGLKAPKISVVGPEDTEAEGAQTSFGSLTEDIYAVPDVVYLAQDINTDYIMPDITVIVIPDIYSDRVGGEQTVTPDISTLDDAEADRLESELSEGETGDGLDFDPLMYPYYQMLDDISKRLYRQIYANASALNDDFKAVETNVTPTQLNNAFFAVVCDHPELFYVDTQYSAAYRNNGSCLEIKLYFNNLADNIDASRSAFENAAASIGDMGGAPYDYEKAAHNALANMDNYSLGAAYNQSAYSALVNGSTVCAGYSRAFQYLMQLAGIPCYYCSGYAGESHAWNIICLDGDFYNVDVTWDDTDSSPAYNYDWFNKTDADYGTTHRRKGLSIYLPPCNGTKYGNLEENPISDEPLQPADTSSDLNAGNIQPESDGQSADGIQQPAGDIGQNTIGGTLDAYGLSEDDIIYDIQSYYNKVLNEASELGRGVHTLYFAADSAEVCDMIRRAYGSNEVEDKLLNKILSNTGLDRIDVMVYPEEADGGRYILKHSISLY